MSEVTLSALLKEGTKLLEESEIQEAGLDAWLLLEYATGKNRAYFFAHGDEIVDTDTAREYRKLIGERAAHIPLQHLTHQAFFMGYEFYVNEHVLVPRQDTETLAEEAIRVLKNGRQPRILDMCTGSGCILLSLLLEIPGSTGTGADISSEALKVAKKNAENLNVSDRAVFVQSNLFSDIYFSKKDGKEGQVYDILVSNPPYIPTEEIDGLMEEVRLHDPRIALDGMADGLAFYRTITEQAGDFLKPGGWLMYEIGCSQGQDVKEIMENAGFVNTRIIQDLCGLDRVVLGQKEIQEEKHV